jgi:hypothetical protein
VFKMINEFSHADGVQCQSIFQERGIVSNLFVTDVEIQIFGDNLLQSLDDLRFIHGNNP